MPTCRASAASGAPSARAPDASSCSPRASPPSTSAASQASSTWPPSPSSCSTRSGSASAPPWCALNGTDGPICADIERFSARRPLGPACRVDDGAAGVLPGVSENVVGDVYAAGDLEVVIAGDPVEHGVEPLLF